MKEINPDAFGYVYFVLVFLVPWAIYGSFIFRGLAYARSRGISLCSSSASERIRSLRQTDSRAAFLHQRALLWMKIVFAIWLIGFATLGLIAFLCTR